ncbi:hypothetical protein K435DRAFT_853590 [Dendrothele bispora CBS 962.96]|uniref:Uncharacterized protein n=1 Tax=Dendrothele bispora (strain CBS 962.96) TaxID=1314807 RepID=A0A4V4HH68_DENBC|nr:hypothetical protein K435DRAFT_853590 [Dendrothele bispora CBS 962.96]
MELSLEGISKSQSQVPQEPETTVHRSLVVLFQDALFPGAIISPKFFRKLTYIDTLSELTYHVSLTQIDIPPAVYQENLKHGSRITLPDMHSSTWSHVITVVVFISVRKGKRMDG